MEHAVHNISPIYNSDSQILILGSFPSVKSREAQFFYHHPQNRFWKLLAALSHEDVPVTIADKKAIRLPSTSPANAAYSLERLILEWSVYLKETLE